MINAKRHQMIVFLTAAFFFALFIHIDAKRVYADDKLVQKVDLTLDYSKLDLYPTFTEYEVNQRIYSACTTLTDGVVIDYLNTKLMYLNEQYNDIWGIGDGDAKVQLDRTYYIRYYLELNDGYDWPIEVKHGLESEFFPIDTSMAFRVYVNGVRELNVLAKYQSYHHALCIYVPAGYELASASISKTTLVYNGKAQKPQIQSVKQINGGIVSQAFYKTLIVNSTGKEVSPTLPGSYELIIKGYGIYIGELRYSFTITKAPGVMKVSGKTASVKSSKLKNKKHTRKRKKVLKISKDKGSLTVKKIKGNKKIVIDETTGKVTIKKGLQKGTYKVKVKVTDKGNNIYAAVSKKVTFKVKVN